MLEKVLRLGEPSIVDIVTGQTPFGLYTNFAHGRESRKGDDLAVHYSRNGRRAIAYIKRGEITKGLHLIDTWKLFVPEAFGERGAKPARVLGWPVIGRAGEICTQTYLAIGPFQSQREVENFRSYYGSVKIFV